MARSERRASPLSGWARRRNAAYGNSAPQRDHAETCNRLLREAAANVFAPMP